MHKLLDCIKYYFYNIVSRQVYATNNNKLLLLNNQKSIILKELYICNKYNYYVLLYMFLVLKYELKILLRFN